MKIKDALLFLVALGVAAAFSKPLPVKVDVKPKKTEPTPTPKKTDPAPAPNTKYVYKLREPKTVAEHCIKTICDTALDMSLDSRKLTEARKIYSMVYERDWTSNISDDEVNYAIGALNLICRSVSLSSNKAEITDLISKINSDHLWG